MCEGNPSLHEGYLDDLMEETGARVTDALHTAWHRGFEAGIKHAMKGMRFEPTHADEPDFDHSNLSSPHFEPLLGQCVCKYCTSHYREDPRNE